MYMLFEHLLFISLNLYCKKVHKKYHEYVIIYITFIIWHHFLQGTMCVEVLMHIVHEDMSV